LRRRRERAWLRTGRRGAGRRRRAAAGRRAAEDQRLAEAARGFQGGRWRARRRQAGMREGEGAAAAAREPATAAPCYGCAAAPISCVCGAAAPPQRWQLGGRAAHL